MTTPKVITRFAPSPTGFLHIGGARTALFNYYFAKHMGGEFRLRVEDTDKARSTNEATQAIIDGMKWLGVHHNGDIVFQSKRISRHKEIVQKLLDSGKAYKCYETAEKLVELKEAHRIQHMESDGISIPGFYTKWRYQNKDTSDPYVVRFKIPNRNHQDWDENLINSSGLSEKNDNSLTIHESVRRGHAHHLNVFDDFILQRSDGTPTYMLAVVVDDHDMGITHVIRGDDHFTNAFKQALIYNSLDWNIPKWTHVPLIHGPDGKKLSKRHGALGIEAYKHMGYIPSGLKNYLIRLGWSHGDEELFFTDDDISKVFTLEGINSAPARLDFDKMDYINGQHIAREPNNDLLAQALPFLEEVNEGPLSEDLKTRVANAMDTLKPRAKTLKELGQQARYLMLKRPLEITGKAAKPLKREGALAHLFVLTSQLKSLSLIHI